MSDLVERLRRRQQQKYEGSTGGHTICRWGPDTDCNEAADRIEQLEAALKGAHHVLKALTAPDMKIGAGEVYLAAVAAEVMVRRAISTKEGTP